MAARVGLACAADSASKWSLCVCDVQPYLKRGFQLEVIQPIDGFHLDAPPLIVVLHVEWNARSGGAARPDLPIEIRHMLRRLAADANNDIAAPDTRFVGGATDSYPAYQQAAAYFFGIDSKPWPARALDPARCKEIAENWRQAVNGNEHVARHFFASPPRRI